MMGQSRRFQGTVGWRVTAPNGESEARHRSGWFAGLPATMEKRGVLPDGGDSHDALQVAGFVFSGRNGRPVMSTIGAWAVKRARRRRARKRRSRAKERGHPEPPTILTN